MGGILLLSEDAEPLRARLTSDGHRVFAVASASKALERARDAEIDLVLSDVCPSGMDGDVLRREMRKLRGARPLPFVFLSRGDKDAAAVSRLSSPTETLRLLVKPVDVSRVAETITRALSELFLEGDMSDDSLVRRLESICKSRASGVLTASREQTVKKMVFKGGGLAFCASNDPRELVGQHFVKAGLITEADLRSAMNRQVTDAQPLGKILQAMSKVTPEQVERALTRKFRETLLDLFLWSDGAWVWNEGEVTEAAQFSTMEVPPLLEQGKRRMERWKELMDLLPDDDVRFLLSPPSFPSGFPATPADKRLLDLAAEGKSLAEIREALPGQDFGIYSRFADFLQMEIARVSGGTHGGTTASSTELAIRSSVRELLDRGTDAMLSDDTDLARELFHAVLFAEPKNPIALRGLAEIDQLLPATKTKPGSETNVPIPIGPADPPNGPSLDVELASALNDASERDDLAETVREQQDQALRDARIQERAKRDLEEREKREREERAGREREERERHEREERAAREREERERRDREERERRERESRRDRVDTRPATNGSLALQVSEESDHRVIPLFPSRPNDPPPAPNPAPSPWGAPLPWGAAASSVPWTPTEPGVVSRPPSSPASVEMPAPAPVAAPTDPPIAARQAPVAPSRTSAAPPALPPAPARETGGMGRMIGIAIVSSSMTAAIVVGVLQLTKAPGTPVAAPTAVVVVATPAKTATPPPVVSTATPAPPPTPAIVVAAATPAPTPIAKKEPTEAEKRAQAKSYTQKGLAKLDAGDGPGAIKLFKQALALDPKNAQAHIGLGTAYMIQGDNAAAKRSLQKFLQVAPGDPLAGQARQLLQSL